MGGGEVRTGGSPVGALGTAGGTTGGGATGAGGGGGACGGGGSGDFAVACGTGFSTGAPRFRVGTMIGRPCSSRIGEGLSLGIVRSTPARFAATSTCDGIGGSGGTGRFGMICSTSGGIPRLGRIVGGSWKPRTRCSRGAGGNAKGGRPAGSATSVLGRTMLGGMMIPASGWPAGNESGGCPAGSARCVISGRRNCGGRSPRMSVAKARAPAGPSPNAPAVRASVNGFAFSGPNSRAATLGENRNRIPRSARSSAPGIGVYPSGPARNDWPSVGAV